MSNIRSKKKLVQFKKQKKDAREILRLKLYQDVKEIRRLDRHIGDFLLALRTDLKKHKIIKLKEHANEFELEVHQELERLIDLTKKDLELYIKVLKSLQQFKKFMQKVSEQGKSYEVVAQAELKYAKIMSKGIETKLSSLSKILKRMRK